MKRSLHPRSIFFTIKFFADGNNLSCEQRLPVRFSFSSRFFRCLSLNNLLGLPFAAFIEAFFLLSQRKYPSSHALIDSVSQLVTTCIRQLNTCLQAPSSPLIHQSNQYLLHRATRMSQTTFNPSTMTHRSNMITLRPTTNVTHRSLIAPSSAPTPRVTQSHQLTTSATAVTSGSASNSSATATTTSASNSESKSRQQSTKSVFPLFFDVL